MPNHYPAQEKMLRLVFGTFFHKGSLITEGILTLVPLPTKGAKSLLSRIFEFSFHFSKLTAQESNLIPFVINGAKIKIPYENKRPLGKTYEKI